MKITLLGEPIQGLSTKEQLLINRGMDKDKINKYLKTTKDDINEPEYLGIDMLHEAVRYLLTTIRDEKPTLVVVDSDNDGYTSAAILINYLHDVFPTYTEQNVSWFIHKGKEHGLKDCVELAAEYSLVICPDSASNDVEEAKLLHSKGVKVFCLDHHDVEEDNPCMIIINNQYSSYPNKDLSGAGVTWQFCRYLDKMLGLDYAEQYYDLVSLGNMGDVMSMQSIETKHLIFEGLKDENIKNPFISEMIEKNEFSLSKPDYRPSRNSDLKISPIGAAFFIVPFVNAIVRSGTIEEKNLIFTSMLKFMAFQEVPSTKRGHALGEKERLVDQAIRTCTNVKNRQTRAVDTGMELLESKIKKSNLMNHKVLLFLLQSNEIDKNIAGLCANKIMDKYQRPCAVLFSDDFDKDNILFQGSARGYGDMDFKAVCLETGCEYAIGHPNAFGLCLASNQIDHFLETTDNVFANLSSEPSYFVDYIWDCENNLPNGQKIIEIADMNDYIGKDFTRSYVYIKNIPVTPETFKVMKSNTLKYELSNHVSMIQFGGTDDQIEMFSLNPSMRINAVCKCAINEYNFQQFPQLVVVDWEVAESFINNKTEDNLVMAWGF